MILIDKQSSVSTVISSEDGAEIGISYSRNVINSVPSTFLHLSQVRHLLARIIGLHLHSELLQDVIRSSIFG